MRVMIKISLTGEAKINSPKGFSLVELLVALTIMSILVGSISLIMFRKEETLKNLSTKIVQNMRLAQQRAIRENKSYQVEIDFSDNSFNFANDAVNLPDDISITIRTAENQQLEKDLVAVTFYPDMSSSGGMVTLESDKEVFEITLTWISGKISTSYHVKSS